MPSLRRSTALLVLALLWALQAPAAAADTVSGLRLIGQQVLPAGLRVQGTVLGGLSGIDYDARHRRFVLISDDRSSADTPYAPRTYMAKLRFDLQGFHSVRISGTQPLPQPGGGVFPKLPALGAPDPEGIRIDPRNGHWVWISEGERKPQAQPPRLTHPFVHAVSPQGRHVRAYRLPRMLRVSAEASGPPDNAAFEGLAFTPDARQLAVMMEGPLLQDGAPPSVAAGSTARLTLFDRDSGQASAQFVVPLERLQAAPVPATAFDVTAATEILALSATRFLLLERSFSVGVAGNQVRLYEIDTEGASNVLDRDLDGAVPVRKRLVLDFETLKAQLGGIANLEGLCFGPRLANGHRSLVLVADDNFAPAGSATDRNQFLVFEVLP